MKEIWKEIKGYEGLYQVSNLGNIKHLKFKKKNVLTGGFSLIKERILKPVKHYNGYVFVDLHKNGSHKITAIHRIVALNFIDNINNKPQVNHFDGNKENNNVINLEWCTMSENMIHALNNGLSRTKLLPNDVIEIRKLLKTGLTHLKIADIFDVKRCVIADISSKRTWNHVNS